MKKRIKHLSELKRHVDALVKKHGESAPCAAWILTRDDFLTVDDNMRDVPVDAREAKSMIDDIHLFEYNWIADQLKRIIDNEKTNRSL